MRANGVPGPNGLPSQIFKTNPVACAPVITKLYNVCYNAAQVPNSWWGSILCPIYKKGERSNRNNCRLIVLLDIEAERYVQTLLGELELWVQKKGVDH